MGKHDFSHMHHSVYRLSYHLVLVTKDRQRVLSDAMLKQIEGIASERAGAWDGKVVGMKGAADHVHLRLELPPTAALATFVNALKTATSRLLRRDFPSLRARYSQPVLWSRSYFAASDGSAPVETVRAYIQAQERDPGNAASPRPLTGLARASEPTRQSGPCAQTTFLFDDLPKGLAESRDARLDVRKHRAKTEQSACTK